MSAVLKVSLPLKPEQSWKHAIPIEVTEFGITKSPVNPVQSLNTLSEIEVREEGNINLPLKPLH